MKHTNRFISVIMSAVLLLSSAAAVGAADETAFDYTDYRAFYDLCINKDLSDPLNPGDGKVNLSDASLLLQYIAG